MFRFPLTELYPCHPQQLGRNGASNCLLLKRENLSFSVSDKAGRRNRRYRFRQNSKLLWNVKRERLMNILPAWKKKLQVFVLNFFQVSTSFEFDRKPPRYEHHTLTVKSPNLNCSVSTGGRLHEFEFQSTSSTRLTISLSNSKRKLKNSMKPVRDKKPVGEPSTGRGLRQNRAKVTWNAWSILFFFVERPGTILDFNCSRQTGSFSREKNGEDSLCHGWVTTEHGCQAAQQRNEEILRYLRPRAVLSFRVHST